MIRAELLALTSTTATKVAAVIAVLGLLLTQLTIVLLLPALADGTIGPGAEVLGDDLPAADLASGLVQQDALSTLGASLGGGSLGLTVLALTLLGVVAATADVRHGGIVGAVLASPRRWGVVGAQAAALAVVGLALGVVLAVISAATLMVSLAASGVPLALEPLAVLAVLARGVLAVVGLVLLGLAVGTVVGSQLGGVLVMLAVLVGEPVVVGVVQLVTGAVPAWTQALPGALTRASIGAVPSPWSPALASTVLVALCALALLAAGAVVRRRDL